jgi:long-chain acyl-CoA synthetase
VSSRVSNEDSLVGCLLSRGAPDALALIHGSLQVTYRELQQRVAGCAQRLLAEGTRKGDRIGIWAENGLLLVVAYLAVIRAGAVAVPMPAESTTESVNRVLLDAGAVRLFLSPRIRRRLNAALLPEGVRLLGEEMIGMVGEVDEALWPDIAPELDLAALMFTSGSTGAPKGVMVTHRNVLTNTSDIVEYLELTAADRVMVVLPFHYCYGLSLLHTHLLAGASLVINNQFLYPEQVLRDMATHACTGLAGVPSTYQILLRKSRFRHLHFPALRWLQQAGGKLPNPFIQELRKSFPAVRFYTMYGQTEGTARLSYLPPERLDRHLGSIGRGLKSTRLEVLRPDGSPVPPGSDEVGEIVASGANITLGYWNDPEETARFFREGRLRTGDLARVDAEGYIYLVEREREMIKSGGHRVGAKEIEEIIVEMPTVIEVAVVGVPDEILGEAIVALVVPTTGSGLTSEQVQAHCHRRLPAFKMPTLVRVVERLPHNANGKVVKSEVVQSIQG